MYVNHIQACNDQCQSGPESTTRMLRFVIATIQQQLETVPDILASFAQEGIGSRFAFGFKANGLLYIDQHADELYWDALASIGDDSLLMEVFMRVPSLGLVKAGFACQLFAGQVGCLDTHNIRMYGLNKNALNVSKKLKPETLAKHVARYCEMCLELGGSASLWAAWCEYKARVAGPGNWPDGAESVSLLHVEACSGTWWETMPQFMLFDETPRFKQED